MIVHVCFGTDHVGVKEFQILSRQQVSYVYNIMYIYIYIDNISKRQSGGKTPAPLLKQARYNGHTWRCIQKLPAGKNHKFGHCVEYTWLMPELYCAVV